MSPVVKTPGSRWAAAVLSGSLWYSKSIPIRLRNHKVPAWPGGTGSSSSPMTMTSIVGSGLPTDPPLASHSSPEMREMNEPSVEP